MSMFSSVSKGQISNEGWKSCSLPRHLGEGLQLTGGCPTQSPSPNPPADEWLHPLQQQLQAVDSCAVSGRKVVPELSQQLKPKLREGREAVCEALLLRDRALQNGLLSARSSSKAAGLQGPALKSTLPTTGLQPHWPRPGALSSLHSAPWRHRRPQGLRSTSCASFLAAHSLRCSRG